MITLVSSPKQPLCTIMLRLRKIKANFEHRCFQFPYLGQCQRPSSGCIESYDIYKSVDCDGDGILDHACSTTVNNNRWLVLSSEGCPSSWGPASRPVSKCPQAFGGMYVLRIAKMKQ